MRIAFLCGSLEPGQDGVGDYTRLLAAACIHAGHDCLVGAIADRSTGMHKAEELQACTGTMVPTFRVSSGTPWSSRVDQMTERLSQFSPDILSLQFVPYSFHRRGHATKSVVEGLAKVLSTAPHRQIMFHELWTAGSRLRDCTTPTLLVRSGVRQIEGLIQRIKVRGLLGRLCLQTVHTSNPKYECWITALSIPNLPQVLQLPLYGNIPIASSGTSKTGITSRRWLFDQLSTSDQDRLNLSNWAESWLCGFFGAIHPEWQPEPLFSHLMEGSWVAQKTLVIIYAGRLGSTGKQCWQRLRERYRKDILFIELGELGITELSYYLSALDLGISTNPLSLLGKSGTVASMLDHGLPVVVSRVDMPVERPSYTAPRDRESSLPFTNSLIYPLDPEFVGQLTEGKLPIRRPAQARLEQISAQFLNDCGLQEIYTPISDYSSVRKDASDRQATLRIDDVDVESLR